MLISFIPYNRIYNNVPRTQNNPTFEAKGKPLTLEYIVENHEKLLPERVLNAVKNVLKEKINPLPSLKEIHTEVYKPLLECMTLSQAKFIFPEFRKINDEVVFEHNSARAKNFKEHVGDNFPLKMLQEYWAKFRNKDDIAKDFGLNSRSSIDWALKNIEFVCYDKNYKTLVKASDEIGNRSMASKTKAWNASHQEEMYARNKKAAQSCKTEEFRKEQSERMKKYDEKHPERREKIAKSSKDAWDLCPEIKEAMKEYTKTLPTYIRGVLKKDHNHIPLTTNEIKIKMGFFKGFWEKYPEFKEQFKKARNQKLD